MTHSWHICMVREKAPLQLQNHFSWICKLLCRTDLCSGSGSKQTFQNLLYPLICEPRSNFPLTVWNSIPSSSRWKSHPLQPAKGAQQRDATTNRYHPAKIFNWAQAIVIAWFGLLHRGVYFSWSQLLQGWNRAYILLKYLIFTCKGQMMVYCVIVKHSAPMLSYFHHSKCLILYLDFADLSVQGYHISWFKVSFLWGLFSLFLSLSFV